MPAEIGSYRRLPRTRHLHVSVSILMSRPDARRYSYAMKLHTRHVMVAIALGVVLLILAALARGLH